MDHQLVKLFVMNCLTHLSLSASISTGPSTTPVCFPGSGRVNECMSYYCDENGQWQEFEFTRTHECCLKFSSPACAKWSTTYSEFITTTTSPSTTSSPPACNSGWMRTKDCRIFFCQDGQWQVGEFTATKECCLRNFNPKCEAMGFTSTGFKSITESPSTATSIPVCDMGSMTVKDCMMFFCQDGQWQVGEFTATRECCLQEFHPKCTAMGFTSSEFKPSTEAPPTTITSPACATGLTVTEDCTFSFCQDGQWQAGEFTATKECCLKEFHPKCQAMGFTSTGQTTGFTSTGKEMGFTSTELISTTIVPTTSTLSCEFGSGRVQDCTVYLCVNGEWQRFEFTVTQECCKKEFHPMCKEMGFTSTGQTTGFTATEYISTTESVRTTSSTLECDSASMQPQECRIFYCQDGQWQVGEFTATMECCLKEFHPMCEEMGFTSTGGLISTTIPPTTLTPACADGDNRAQDCTINVCLNGEWQPFEFTPTQECCLKEFHPKCGHMGFTSPVSSSSTTSPNSDCSPGSIRVQDCGVYVCENGQWQLFEFFSSDECCEKENHPKCAELGTPPPDDRSPKDWPLTDSDSSDRLDILLIRLPLLQDLPFPVVYRNGGPLKSHKDRSDGPKNFNHAVRHRE